MLNNAGTAPAADKASKTAVGALFAYWPDNPLHRPAHGAGQASQGGYFDSPGRDGAYSAAVAQTPSGRAGRPRRDRPPAAQERPERRPATSSRQGEHVLPAGRDRPLCRRQQPAVPGGRRTRPTLSPWAIDYWPSNPWLAGMDMGSGTGAGLDTPTRTRWTARLHALRPPERRYGLHGRRSSGRNGSEAIRDNLKDMCVQAHGQVLQGVRRGVEGGARRHAADGGRDDEGGSGGRLARLVAAESLDERSDGQQRHGRRLPVHTRRRRGLHAHRPPAGHGRRHSRSTTRRSSRPRETRRGGRPGGPPAPLRLITSRRRRSLSRRPRRPRAAARRRVSPSPAPGPPCRRCSAPASARRPAAAPAGASPGARAPSPSRAGTCRWSRAPPSPRARGGR